MDPAGTAAGSAVLLQRAGSGPDRHNDAGLDSDPGPADCHTVPYKHTYCYTAARLAGCPAG